MTPGQRKKAFRYGGPILLLLAISILFAFMYAMVEIARAIITVGR